MLTSFLRPIGPPLRGALAAGAALLVLSCQSGGGVLRAESPAGEFRLLPLRIHLLRSDAFPELDCRLHASDASRILAKVNGVWRAAGLQFFPTAILSEPAARQSLWGALGDNRTEGHLRLLRPLESLAEQSLNVYYLHAMRPNGICLDRSGSGIFVKDTARLNPVPGGIDEPLPRVTSHELGHALGLDHREERLNLMASGTTGTSLNDAEIRTARATAAGWSWVLSPEQALEEVSRLQAADRREAPRGLLEVLAALPESDVSRTARQRLRSTSSDRK